MYTAKGMPNTNSGVTPNNPVASSSPRSGNRMSSLPLSMTGSQAGQGPPQVKKVAPSSNRSVSSSRPNALVALVSIWASTTLLIAKGPPGGANTLTTLKLKIGSLAASVISSALSGQPLRTKTVVPRRLRRTPQSRAALELIAASPVWTKPV